MWTAIAESKNETMRCPVALKPKEPPAPEVAKRRAEGQEGPPQPEGFATEAPRDGGELNDERSSNEMEGARLAVAALQGAWESQRNSSETYVVQGLDVARHQRQSNGTVTKRPYSLRWNPSKRCLEWGSGKYFLQAPAAVPMVEAVWPLELRIVRCFYACFALNFSCLFAHSNVLPEYDLIDGSKCLGVFACGISMVQSSSVQVGQ